MKMYSELREANVARDAVWDKNKAIDVKWRMLELVGEAGELCNEIKKMIREIRGLPGSRTSEEKIAAETADVVICLDLLLMTLEVRPVHFHSEEFMAGMADCNAEDIALILMDSLLWMMDTINCDQEPYDEARQVYTACVKLSRKLEFRLDKAVSGKFNEVSDKIGLPVRLEWHGNV